MFAFGSSQILIPCISGHIGLFHLEDHRSDTIIAGDDDHTFSVGESSLAIDIAGSL